MEAKEKKEQKETRPAVINKNITDEVLIKVTALRESGLLRLPEDYAPENALKGAYIILQDVKTKEGQLAIDVCTRESIALSLLKMVTEGLNPLKKQGSFIPRGNTLCWEREYDGDVALAMRAGLKWIRSRCIFEGDDYLTKIDEKGVKSLVKHDQPIENIDITKIKGAYAVYEFNDQIELIEMTIRQIKQSWLQGSMKGNSGAHNNFTDEMCRRTIERRACKPIIRRSNDSYLEDEPEEVQESKSDSIKANAEIISFTETEEIKDNKQPEKKEGEKPEKSEPIQQEIKTDAKPGF
jgi:recombination protein RecT